MTTFIFETITADQATSFDVTKDVLNFQTTASAHDFQVAYATAANAITSVTLRNLDSGQAVVFGPGVAGETLVLPDGSQLGIGGAGNDLLQATHAGSAVFGGLGDDSLFAVGGSVLQGNQGNDVLSATGGGNVLFGGQGDDKLFASDGSNFLQGNLGDDTLDASSDDIVQEHGVLLGGQGDDVILDGVGSDFLSGDKGADTITSRLGADTLQGADGNNRLIIGSTNTGAVTLDAGAGDDTISDAGSAATMTGGTGADIFSFSRPQRSAGDAGRPGQ